MSNEITVGCWIDTRWGPSVCISIRPGFVGYRYEGKRPDGKTIWVANGDSVGDVTYRGSADDKSRWVTTLRGPYGEGFVVEGYPDIFGY